MTGTALEPAAKRYEIVRPPIPTHDEINRTWRMAEALAASGVFPDAKETAKAFAVMLVGHDLGLSPTQALQGIYLISGRPMVGYTLLGSFVKRIPGYDYKVLEREDDHARIAFYQDGEKLGESKFDKDDAMRAKIIDANGKPLPRRSEAWATYPRAMYLARALSEGIRAYMPDATGGIPVYAEDEIPESAKLTAGQDGDPIGIDLGPKVEKVLARAKALGHVGLADRAAAEMALGNRSPEVAVKWVENAEAELDAFEARGEAEPISDAEVVTGDASEGAAAKRAAAEALLAEAEGMEPDEANARRDAALRLANEAEALEAGE